MLGDGKDAQDGGLSDGLGDFPPAEVVGDLDLPQPWPSLVLSMHQSRAPLRCAEYWLQQQWRPLPDWGMLLTALETPATVVLGTCLCTMPVLCFYPLRSQRHLLSLIMASLHRVSRADVVRFIRAVEPHVTHDSCRRLLGFIAEDVGTPIPSAETASEWVEALAADIKRLWGSREAQVQTSESMARAVDGEGADRGTASAAEEGSEGDARTLSSVQAHAEQPAPAQRVAALERGDGVGTGADTSDEPTGSSKRHKGTELDEGLRVRVAEAQEALRGGFVDRVDMTLLSAVPYAELVEISEQLALSKLDEQVACSLCERVFAVDGGISIRNAVFLVQVLLLPKVRQLEQSASRRLQQALRSVVTSYCNSLMDGLLNPLVGGDLPLGSAQADALARLIKDGMKEQQQIQAVRRILELGADSGQRVWQEPELVMLNQLLALRLRLPDDAADALLALLQRHAGPCAGSLKYGTLLLTAATKYSAELKRHQGALKAVAAAHKTFMAKSVAAAIEKM